MYFYLETQHRPHNKQELLFLCFMKNMVNFIYCSCNINKYILQHKYLQNKSSGASCSANY